MLICKCRDNVDNEKCCSQIMLSIFWIRMSPKKEEEDDSHNEESGKAQILQDKQQDTKQGQVSGIAPKLG